MIRQHQKPTIRPIGIHEIVLSIRREVLYLFSPDGQPMPRSPDTPLPTVQTALDAYCIVSGTCADCDHVSRLDLARLVTLGYGDVDLIRLPLRFVYGSERSQISVSGRAYR